MTSGRAHGTQQQPVHCANPDGRRIRAAAWCALIGSLLPVAALVVGIVGDQLDPSEEWDGLVTFFALWLLIPTLLMTGIAAMGVILVHSAFTRGRPSRMRGGAALSVVVATIQLGLSLTVLGGDVTWGQRLGVIAVFGGPPLAALVLLLVGRAGAGGRTMI